MKKSLILCAFAISVLCVSCSTEQKIDRLIDKAEELVNDKSASNREVKLAKIGEKLESYKDSDFTSSQASRLSKVMSNFYEY